MSKAYFGKEIASNKLIVAGAAVAFTIYDGNRGLIELESDNPADKPIIDALNKLAGKQGVYKLSAEDFSKKAKTWPLRASVAKSNLPEIRPMPGRRLNPLERAGAVPPAADGFSSLPQVPAQALDGQLSSSHPTTDSPLVGDAPPAIQDFRPAVRKVKRSPIGDLTKPG